MTGEPTLSVIMANLNGAAHIAEAVRSVLSQTERSLELILSDDGSTDDSLARAGEAAGGDSRLRIVRGGDRSGPAATRNRAIAAARGAWIAIVDNDDTVAPDRFERLLRAAEADGADIAADNLTTFYQSGEHKDHAHLRISAPFWVDAAAYAESNILLRGGAQLGYLKPLFRRSALSPAPYDETLRIGEDSDLVLRLLIGGARMRIYPECGYRYRKHAGSISHRLSREALEAMLAAHDKLNWGSDAALRQALARQRAALLDALAFNDLVDALKHHSLGAAISAALKRPNALIMLKEPVLARFRRLVRPR